MHLPHKSDAVMEMAVLETKFWALLGIEPGTLGTRVKDLNHCATLQDTALQIINLNVVVSSPLHYGALFDLCTGV